MAKRKGKKPKESFKEILDKGLEAVVDVLKRADVKDIAEVAIYGGLAWAGYQAPLLDGFPESIKLIWGPLALKLATTPAYGGEISLGLGGVDVPVNSQIAGLAMLALLGFGSLPWEDILSGLPRLPRPFGPPTQEQLTGDKFREYMDKYERVIYPSERERMGAIWDNIIRYTATFHDADRKASYVSLDRYLDVMQPQWQVRLDRLEQELVEPR